MEYKKLKSLISLTFCLLINFNIHAHDIQNQGCCEHDSNFSVDYSLVDKTKNILDDLSLFGTFTTTIYNTNSKAITENPGTKILNHLIFNASYNINENTDIVGSLSIKNTTYNENYFPVLDYLSINYTNFFPSISLQPTIRVGRVKMNDLLLSDERNNSNSRWSVTLPFSVHWPAFAHFEQSIDGIQIELTRHNTTGNNITFSATYGYMDILESDKRYVAYGYLRHLGTNNTIKNNGLIQSYVLKYQNKNLLLKAAKTKYPLGHNVEWWKYLTVSPNDYDITEPNVFNDPVFGFVHDYESFGFRYHDKERQYCISSEYVRHLNFPSKPYTYYLRGCKMLTQQLGLGVEYSGLSYQNKQLMPTAIPSWSKNGNSYKLNVFYNIDSKQKIKAEWAQGSGTVWFPYPGSKSDWYLFSISYTYKFHIF